MAAELDALGRALADPRRPLVAVVAGAKVSTKLTILRALAAKVDVLVVGGGIANTFILAAGGKIGKSIAESELAGEAKAILEHFPGKVFETVIRSSIAYAESAEKARSILDHRPDLGADYLALADEMFERLPELADARRRVAQIGA